MEPTYVLRRTKDGLYLGRGGWWVDGLDAANVSSGRGDRLRRYLKDDYARLVEVTIVIKDLTK